MKEVKIVDNFFDNSIREKIFNLIVRRPKWKFGAGDFDNMFWSMDKLEQEEYFSEYLYGLICSKLNKTFKNVLRIYANGQTAGQHGSLHTDDGDVTILYFPNPHWNQEQQGHLFFSEDGESITQVVEYKPNRLVMFPASLSHYPDAPHRLYPGLRISLAYKLEV